MKKILLSATVLLCMTALSKAQQGRVGINTETPAATLDVVANTSDSSKPDALLVPRMSRAQLAAKNAAYQNSTTVPAENQNGALVFVNTLDGTAADKVVNVTATGFYYYDAPNSVWKAVGGGASAPQRYENTRGGVTILTSNSTYTAVASDFFIITKAGSAFNIDLPDPSGNVGRLIYVANNNTASGAVVVQSAGSSTLLVGTIAQNRAKAFISDGTAWVSISFN